MYKVKTYSIGGEPELWKQALALAHHARGECQRNVLATLINLVQQTERIGLRNVEIVPQDKVHAEEGSLSLSKVVARARGSFPAHLVVALLQFLVSKKKDTHGS